MIKSEATTTPAKFLIRSRALLDENVGLFDRYQKRVKELKSKALIFSATSQTPQKSDADSKA